MTKLEKRRATIPTLHPQQTMKNRNNKQKEEYKDNLCECPLKCFLYNKILGKELVNSFYKFGNFLLENDDAIYNLMDQKYSDEGKVTVKSFGRKNQKFYLPMIAGFEE